MKIRIIGTLVLILSMIGVYYIIPAESQDTTAHPNIQPPSVSKSDEASAMSKLSVN